MSYNEEKLKLIIEIDKELKPLSITQLEDVLTIVKDKKPLKLKEFLRKEFEKGNICGTGVQEIFCTNDIIKAFEHEVRAICMELGPNFKKIETTSEYIDHFCEMYAQGHTLDIWIHENGALFNPCELAHVIYLLYTGEVIF